ncbi:DUF6300 family protein [Actinomadura sp. HBU206391]|uniref:DUF6300 family protein n=1 Tax=Actinomadura sp. HBU206391 TaxID=2731692 RepID=UPI001C9C3009
MRHSDKPEIDVINSAIVPDCPRCGGEGLLSARVPYGWERADGQRTAGSTIVVLCSECDADDQHGGPLITFFHVHERISADKLHECADLIRLWAKNLQIPELDEAALDAEIEAWRNDDL